MEKKKELTTDEKMALRITELEQAEKQIEANLIATRAVLHELKELTK